jgi:methyl-accepting chemotaxis protein
MSNAVGNAPEPANQTVERGENTSNTMNKTGEAVNATAYELGKNASDMGSTILNKTGEVGKKIIGGAADVLANISGEMKKP